LIAVSGTTITYAIPAGLNISSITGGGLSIDNRTSFVYDNEFRIRSGVRHHMHQYVKTYVYDKGRAWRLTVPHEQLIDSNSEASVHAACAPSYSKDIVTFEVAVASEAQGTTAVWSPGDMVFHILSGTIYVVLSVGVPVSGYRTIRCEQQNGLQLASDGTFIENLGAIGGPDDNTTWAGYIVHITTGAWLPTKLLWGKYTAGSGNVVEIDGGDGYGGDIWEYYAAGDPMYGIYSYPGMPIGSWPTIIASVTVGSPASIGLSAAAGADGRFPIFPYELR
jgi:hypothetical protein